MSANKSSAQVLAEPTAGSYWMLAVRAVIIAAYPDSDNLPVVVDVDSIQTGLHLLN